MVETAICYLILKPNDKKVSKRLDHDLDLDEKVQTMIECEKDDSLMASLQREDTDDRLKKIDAKSFKLKIGAIFYILLSVGLIMMTASLIVPKYKEKGEEPEPEKPFNLTEWQIEQITALIKYVESSEMKEDMKTSYKGELETLIDALKETHTQASMRVNVLTAITNMNLYMMTANTSKEFCTRLEKIKATNIYVNGNVKEYEFKEGDKLTFYANTTLENQKVTFNFITYTGKDEHGVDIEITGDPIVVDIDKNSNYQVPYEITCPKTGTYSLSLPDSVVVIEHTGTSYLSYLGEASRGLSTTEVSDVLNNMQKYYLDKKSANSSAFIEMLKCDLGSIEEVFKEDLDDETNILYQAIKMYVDGVRTTINSASKDMEKNFKKTIDEMEPVLVREIGYQSENKDVCYYVEDKLRELFGLGPATNREEYNGSGNGSESTGGDGKLDFTGGGGLGDGDDESFAATDLIYDYDNNILVAYGNLYYNYHAIILGLINDGALTEEMIQYINSYYDSLIKSETQE